MNEPALAFSLSTILSGKVHRAAGTANEPTNVVPGSGAPSLRVQTCGSLEDCGIPGNSEKQ